MRLRLLCVSVGQFVPSEPQDTFDAFIAFGFKPNPSQAEARQERVPVPQFFQTFWARFDNEMLREVVAVVARLDRLENLNCPVVVQTAPEKQKAVVAKIVVEQLRNRQRKINVICTIGSVVLV